MTPTITDAHVHIRDASQIAHFQRLAERIGLSSIGLVCTAGKSGSHDNAFGFLAKHRRPGFYYLFAGLDHRDAEGRPVTAAVLADQIDRYVRVGVDGIKIIESKPGARRALGHALDGDYFAPAFQRIAAHELPVVWHVADPEEFWDPALTPAWAAERGWGYDASDPAKESLYQEAEAVLRRHPSLRVVFAHFYFLSADLDRAAALFDTYPGVSIDLAPGIEMYYNLSRNTAAARAFFTTYADRIVYGTDLGIFPGESLETSIARAELVLRFLRARDEYRIPPEADFLLGPPEDGVIRGLGLSEESLAKILGGNYRALVGESPRLLDRKLAAAECSRYVERTARSDEPSLRAPLQGIVDELSE
jgi:predicted TIM-barrel fold metal-dependent hydrolase